MIIFPKNKFFFAVLGLTLLGAFSATGCAPSPSPKQAETFGTEQFLTAEGAGRSETDARQQALAQLSAIFEARISSDFTSQTRESLSSDQAESFESEMASRVHVASGVRLEGARIGKTWKNETSGEWMALAILNRMDAGRTWADALDTVDSRIQAELAVKSPGTLSRIAALNRVMELDVQRQVLESRLRVVGFPAMGMAGTDLAAVMAERAKLIAGLKVFVSVSGEHGLNVGDALAQALTGKGIALTSDPGQANARVLGEVEVTDLNLGNPGAWFVRAMGNVLVFEADPQTLFVQINEKVRKGHKDPEEARFKAVEALGAVFSTQLLAALGY